MPPSVTRFDDPAEVLALAGDFLAADPVSHNLILTLLRARVDHPEPGRYWVVSVAAQVVGVVFQSPLAFVATITPMHDPAIDAAVAAISTEGAALPGVSGSAASAARFAGAWTEQHRSAARPELGQRLYELDVLAPPAGVAGAPRPADKDDLAFLGSWVAGFQADVGEHHGDPEEVATALVGSGGLWIWDHEGPVAMARATSPVAGVARIGPVYTPPGSRSQGYASAVVGELSGQTQARGLRCILYTDLENPTSNSIYRRLGYRAVQEVLRYRFS